MLLEGQRSEVGQNPVLRGLIANSKEFVFCLKRIDNRCKVNAGEW